MLVLALAIILVAGCGPKKAESPEDAARMLIAAFAKGDNKTAADMIAWDTIAKRANPDWDSFANHDRRLIVDKEKEMNATQLQNFGNGLSGGEVGQSTPSGDGATVSVRTSAGQFNLEAAQTDAGWKIIMPAQL
jgi:hypothetical protein